MFQTESSVGGGGGKGRRIVRQAGGYVTIVRHFRLDVDFTIHAQVGEDEGGKFSGGWIK